MTTQRECAICASAGIETEGVVEIPRDDVRDGLELRAVYACAECAREMQDTPSPWMLAADGALRCRGCQLTPDLCACRRTEAPPLGGEASHRLSTGDPVACEACGAAGPYDPAADLPGAITHASDGVTLLCADCPDALAEER